MPYPVSHLIEGRPDPTSVHREDPVLRALSQMIEHDFSQLPVVDETNFPIGMVTYEGVLRGVRNFHSQLSDLHVRDVMVNAPTFNLEDDLFELLEQLKLTNAVLIVNPENKLAGIVTSYDSTEYFRNRAENLMRVEDIEVMIKDFILLAYTHEDGSIDDVSLRESISRVQPGDSQKGKNTKQISFDDISLGQYISILLSKHTWTFFDPIFKIPRDSLGKLLDEVRITRNELAHFRSEITSEQSDQLRFCADWLARCQEEYENVKSQKLFQQLIEAAEQTPTGPTHKIRETASVYDGSPESLDVRNKEVIPEEVLPGESRYAPLADYLNSQPGSIDMVKLTFDEIEEIIGGELPKSAYAHRAWWANDSVSHPQSKLWLEIGWRRSYLNMSEKHVTFVRIRDREKAYINFFNELVSDLRKKADYSIRDVSPDGSSWAVIQIISSVVSFNYCFTRGNRFRVELYIDSGDQTSNKKVFDLIHAHQTDLETKVGKITWERIDDKRASRIAIYHQGAITNDSETLSKLRDWAVEKMISFYNALEPIATQAVKEVFSE